MATVTIKKAPYMSFGGMRLAIGTIDMDASYPTGGEAISLPLTEVWGMFIENKAGYVFEYDYTNKKVKALYPQGGEQVGDGLGGAAVDSGATAVTSSAANGAIVTVDAGKAREVADATDLSGVTNISFLAFGW